MCNQSCHQHEEPSPLKVRAVNFHLSRYLEFFLSSAKHQTFTAPPALLSVVFMGLDLSMGNKY